MRRGGGAFALRGAVLAFGFGFLYAPIMLLVLYSFNASRLVTVWAGFSTRWYGELAKNEGFRAAALTSLEVALMAASLALVLGTFAGFGMARFSRFPGRPLFGFALMAPLVVPEVILGLSLLLMFVAETSKKTPPVIEPEFTQLFMGVRVLPVEWSNRKPTSPYMIAADEEGVFVKLTVL